MDINKELLKITQNKNEIKNVLTELKKDQEIAEQKTHIFHIIEFIHQVKELSPLLIEEGVQVIKLINCDNKRSYAIELAPRTANGERLEVRDEDQKFLPWFRSLLDIYPEFKLNNNLTNNFTDSNIYLNENIEEQMYDVLLSKDLYKILNYHLLNLDLEEKNQQKNLKINKM